MSRNLVTMGVPQRITGPNPFEVRVLQMRRSQICRSKALVGRQRETLLVRGLRVCAHEINGTTTKVDDEQLCLFLFEANDA